MLLDYFVSLNPHHYLVLSYYVYVYFKHCNICQYLIVPLTHMSLKNSYANHILICLYTFVLVSFVCHLNTILVWEDSISEGLPRTCWPMIMFL